MRRLVIGLTLFAVLTAGCQKNKAAVQAQKAAADGNAAAAPEDGGARGAGEIVGNIGANVQAGKQRQSAKGLMENIGLFYHQFNTENGRSPRSQKEFTDYIKKDAPHVVKAIEDATITVVWNAPLSTNTILAYEKEPYGANKARLVMRGDKSMEVMAEIEFQRLLRGVNK